MMHQPAGRLHDAAADAATAQASAAAFAGGHDQQ